MHPLPLLRSGLRSSVLLEKLATGFRNAVAAAAIFGSCLPAAANQNGGLATALKTALPRGAAIQPTAYLRVAADTAGERSGLRWIDTRFNALDGAAVNLRFALSSEAGLRSMRQFGISEPEVDALFQDCRQQRTCGQNQYQARLQHYYHAHKLRMRSVPGVATSLYVDVPKVVEHHRHDVRPVAIALRQWARGHNQQPQALFTAAASLVQTSLAYQTPAAIDAGRKTLGFYPPPRALEKGYGDCDTKSALLAAILANLDAPPVVGVRVPNHYLLGIGRQPQAGEAWIEYRGQAYVLLEAAGPAQRPAGQVSDQTQLALATGQEVRIDPMF